MWWRSLLPATALAILAPACDPEPTGPASCDTLGGVIDDDRTLDRRCYRVTETVSQQGTSRVTVAAGVTLYFEADTGWEVTDDAVLEVEGIVGHPVRLTGTTEERGFWRGIYFENAGAAESEIRYADIAFAGGAPWEDDIAAAVMLGGSGYPSRCVIRNTTVRQSAGYGVALDENAEAGGFRDNVLTENALGPAWALVPAVHWFDPSTTYHGNDRDQVAVQGDYGGITDVHEWAALDVPYRIEGALDVEPGGRLRLLAGARLEFAAGAGLNVTDSGILTTLGTETAPVVLTGTEPVRGHWNGVYLLNTESFESALDWTVIEYAGGADHEGFSAGLFVDDSGFASRCNLTHTVLRHHRGYGLYLDRTSLLPVFTGNTLTDNEAPVFVYAEGARWLDDASNYAGNDDDHAVIQGDYGDLEGNLTWEALDVPYRVQGSISIPDGCRLDLAPGLHAVFADDGELFVQGALRARGAADAPIVLEGETGTPGSWYGIHFLNTNSPDNVFEYVTVADAGGYDYTGAARGNLVLDSSGYPLALQITRCDIRDGAGWGIWAAAEAVLNVDVESANTFAGNAAGDYFHE